MGWQTIIWTNDGYCLLLHICITRTQWVKRGDSFCPGDTIRHQLIGSSLVNSLASVWHQAITWNNVDLLSIGPEGQTSMKLVKNGTIFLNKNVFQNVVYQIMAILFMPQCVKKVRLPIFYSHDTVHSAKILSVRSYSSFMITNRTYNDRYTCDYKWWVCVVYVNTLSTLWYKYPYI